jgi:hypothetical protein
MDKKTKQLQNDSLRFMLWGVLLIKCFLLEYFAKKYSVPVNTTVYVWSLSAFMGIVATTIHLKLRFEAFGQVKHISLSQIAWAVGITVGVAVALVSYQTSWIPKQLNLAIIAALLGSCYGAQGLLEKKVGGIISGFGWWAGAAILFRTAAPQSYLVFAVCIFAFSIIPSLLVYIARRRTPIA